jgi:hypothetical protein
VAISALQKWPEDASEAASFSFEHMMAHRYLMSAFAQIGAATPPATGFETTPTPLSDFSVLPYLLDPMYDMYEPGSKWQLNHQQAHNDFSSAIASPFGIEPTPVGVLPGQILLNSPLDTPGPLQWWTFVNHTEHLFGLYALFWLTELSYPSW